MLNTILDVRDVTVHKTEKLKKFIVQWGDNQVNIKGKEEVNFEIKNWNKFHKKKKNHRILSSRTLRVQKAYSRDNYQGKLLWGGDN